MQSIDYKKNGRSVRDRIELLRMIVHSVPAVSLGLHTSVGEDSNVVTAYHTRKITSQLNPFPSLSCKSIQSIAMNAIGDV